MFIYLFISSKIIPYDYITYKIYSSLLRINLNIDLHKLKSNELKLKSKLRQTVGNGDFLYNCI